MTAEGSGVLSPADRAAILHREIAYYVAQGWTVANQTETTANLVKKKKFSIFWGIVWFLLALVPFLIYLIYYLAKQDQSAFITIDEYGSVQTTRS